MLKRWMQALSVLLCVVMAGALFPTTTYAIKGIDRSRFKDNSKSYSATLRIGTSISVDGTITRMNSPTAQDIEQAIKETMAEMNCTELDVAEAEAIVNRVKESDKLTPQRKQEIMKNLAGLIPGIIRAWAQARWPIFTSGPPAGAALREMHRRVRMSPGER